MKLVHYGDTRAKRRAESPPVEEQLGVIWKALAEIKGITWSPVVHSMIDQMAKVEAKYPKKVK